VLLLLTGASGVGKTSARIAIMPELAPRVECLELSDLAPVSPTQMTRVWRQQTVEQAVRRAIELQPGGRHLLLAGDPVPAAELVAAPSSPELAAVAVCLLDADAESQAARLRARGDAAGLALLPDHQAFADWMRHQAADPLYMPHVVSEGGWDAMRWERLERVTDRWQMRVIDTSSVAKSEVAADVLRWCREVLAGTAPAFRVPGP
jgi:hypothetical protein